MIKKLLVPVLWILVALLASSDNPLPVDAKPTAPAKPTTPSKSTAPAQRPASIFTGHYTNNHGATENSLAVKELPGHKIQFAIDSVWIGNAETGAVNTGGAKGITKIEGTKATFRQDKMTLNFAFSPKGCTVKCNDNAQYGGLGVDPNGFYKRVDKKTPSTKELDNPY